MKKLFESDVVVIELLRVEDRVVTRCFQSQGNITPAKCGAQANFAGVA
ncbi:MAG: hypothetical protein MUF62_00155 [Chitinophagaceae bacterium]|jgi:hypothetical protein|nr:hypothetical protein [Chitinophagaceae bacterium]